MRVLDARVARGSALTPSPSPRKTGERGAYSGKGSEQFTQIVLTPLFLQAACAVRLRGLTAPMEHNRLASGRGRASYCKNRVFRLL